MEMLRQGLKRAVHKKTLKKLIADITKNGPRERLIITYGDE